MRYKDKKRILILASASPRRNTILKDAHIKFKTIIPNIKEYPITKTKDIVWLVKYNSLLKAEAVAKKVKQGIVLGFDTLVLFKKKIIGKIKDIKEAEALLRSILGKRIWVYTGICIIDKYSNHRVYGFDKTAISVRKISPKKITRFIKYLGPYDKAGGFSIEGMGAVLFDDLRGSYFNILGLPLGKLALLLEKIGLDILDFVRL